MHILTTSAALLAVATATPVDRWAVDPALDWRVVGGQDAPEGAFPFIISLLTLWTGSHSCGGAIVNEYYVLTAAHCVTGGIPELYSITVGTNHLDSGGFSYNVSKFIVHSSYNANTAENDIALIKTTTPIDLSAPNVQAAQLPTANPEDDIEVFLAGWGMLEYPGYSPNDLQYLKLRTLSNEECQERASSLIFPSQVCTFTEVGEGSCFGDSGGPLVDSNGTLVGLVSWGTPCARGYPDVYSRVYSYLDWISANVQLD